jgi:competence protein ComEA
MIATRPSRLGALLSMSLAVLLGPASSGFAQATKTVAPQTKAKAKVAEPAKAKEPIDLNSATAEELATLPGIGEVSARKIIDSRPHKVVADLVKAGISASEVDKITPLVVVRPLPPAVEINVDPEEKLESLPGIGAATAKAIVAGRPYGKYEDLEKVRGLGPKKIDELKGRLSFAKAEPVAKKVEVKKVESPSRVDVKKVESPSRVDVKKVETKVAEPAKEKMTKTAKATDAPKLAPGTKVNLNKASKDELDALPGIGPVYAQAIIDARPYSKIEDVMKVKGIKEVEFAKIKDMITAK